MQPGGPYVDSHCHLTMDAFEGDREEALERARSAGVGDLMIVSATRDDAEAVRDFARGHDRVWAAVGVHPHEAKAYDESIEGVLRRCAADPAVLAVGEIGLDYHYDHSPREIQRDVFRRQVRLAHELALPLVIHTRQARADTIRILEEEGVPARRGVFHCFTEDDRTAAWALENGFLISFSGVITFRNADELRGVARGVPIEKTLIETDSPYLSPVPLRGRRNEPAHLSHVAACLGELHGLSAEETGRLTGSNFRTAFRLPPDGGA